MVELFVADVSTSMQPSVRAASTEATWHCFLLSTAISIDEGVSQEQIYENLRLHKEVLSSVKHQPWGMRRKLRLVQQAKAYVKKHEGELKERLAQSKTTRDIMSRFNILLVKRWQYMRRELANLVNVLIPWELRIKEIESHFGSVVASYFTFLRWLFWVNLVIAVLLAAFVAIPEMLTADPKSAGERKVLPPGEEEKSTKLSTIWNFEGVLKYSPIFYGYYTNRDGTEKGYRLPFAYFMTGLAVYVYSFVATLRRMAENSRMSKLSEKDDECIFTWKLFTGWDYMIGNAETAHNRVASIILGFKEALLEEAERKRDARNWRVIGCRVLVNLSVLVLLASSAYAVVLVVNRSTEDGANDTWWRQNEITVVLSLISFVFPIIFELLGLMESYHPRKQLRLQLARIMVLNLLNLYTLIFALFGKISQMTIELQKLKPNTTTVGPPTTRSTSSVNYSDITTSSSVYHSIPSVECYEIEVPCTSLTTTTTTTPDVTTSALAAAFLMAKIASTSLAPYLVNNLSTLTESTLPGENMTMDYSTVLNNLTTNYMFLNTTSSSFEYANDTFSNWTEVETYFNSTEFSVTSENYSLCSKEEFSPDCTFYDEAMNVSTSFAYQENVTKYPANETVRESEHVNVSHTTEDSSMRSSLLSTTAVSTANDSSSTSSTEVVYTTTEEAGATTLVSSEWDDFYPSTSSTTVEEVDKMCFKRVCPPVPETSSVPLPSSTGSQEDLLPGPMCPSARIDGASGLDDETRRKLGQLCWETMFGQELVKLTVMDLVITIVSTLVIDFIRAIFVRVMNHCWCWDLEKQFPQYGDFKIAENILHLVNNQGMVWMGMFFSPGLPLLNLVKLTILMYLRSWAVLTCNVPHEVVFRASRSNNFYLALLLTMLFLCVLPVGYAIVWVAPSWHCGPFANYERIYHLFTKSLYKVLPQSLHRALDYIASPGIVIPLLVLLILIIYYLLSLAGALREANNDLKIQLRRERTEERRKMFQLVDRRRRADSADTPFSRWRKILPVMPSSKPGSQIEERTTGASNGGQGLGNSSTSKTDANRAEMLAKLVKRALRKSSATSDEESALVGLDGDGSSDAQHREDLPREKPKSHKQRVRGGGNSTTTTTTTNNRGSDRSSESKLRSVVRSPSTSSYREREDSLVSGWSDTIPVIRISPTDGSDSNTQKAEPQQPVATKTTDEDEGVAPVHESKRVARVLLEGAGRSDSQGELLDMMELPAKDTPLRKKRELGQAEVSASIAKPESDEETSSATKSNVL